MFHISARLHGRASKHPSATRHQQGNASNVPLAKGSGAHGCNRSREARDAPHLTSSHRIASHRQTISAARMQQSLLRLKFPSTIRRFPIRFVLKASPHSLILNHPRNRNEATLHARNGDSLHGCSGTSSIRTHQPTCAPSSTTPRVLALNAYQSLSQLLIPGVMRIRSCLDHAVT